jgi:FtsP/CotA-like multicopper oxidase with cupredoxin domain
MDKDSSLTRFTRRDILSGISVLALPVPALANEPAQQKLIEAKAGKAAMVKSAETDIWGFEGTSPGPLLRYEQGERLNIKFINRLDYPMSIHWHGMRGFNEMEGVVPLTQSAVLKNQSFDYIRDLTEPGLFCYRPSVYGKTPELMGLGLKGLVIVDELKKLEADLDLALVLDDCRLDHNRQIIRDFNESDAAEPKGSSGTLLTVNGQAAPLKKISAPGSRIRLRIANLANARIMIVNIKGATPYVIAIDSQPCAAFEPVKHSIPIAPGARFEIMFDMPATEEAKVDVLLNNSEDRPHNLIEITAKGQTQQTRQSIVSLPQNPTLPAEIKLANSKKVDLVISAIMGGKTPVWLINGKAGKAYSGSPLFVVRSGTPVTLSFINQSPEALAMHVHGQAMRLLHDLDDGWEPYWRNAVIVPPRKTKHVAFIPEAPGKWAIHDDILEHEALGLACWFLVE